MTDGADYDDPIGGFVLGFLLGLVILSSLFF